MEEIKASDIMLNNWFSYANENGTFNLQVEEIRPTGIITTWNGGAWFVSYDKLKGIPLTEDVLLKCGASIITIDNKNSYTPNGYVGRIFKIGEFKCYVDREYNKWAYRATMIQDINHLHELQNLVRCLTKTELIVEL